MSDWITQLEEDIGSWVIDPIKPINDNLNMGQRRRIARAARLLASGRQPDLKAARQAYEDAPVPIRSEDFVKRIVTAALGGSDVLIVDMGEETP